MMTSLEKVTIFFDEVSKDVGRSRGVKPCSIYNIGSNLLRG